MEEFKNPYKVGDIFVHSIGCGHDNFWQVIKSTPKTIRVKLLEYKITKRDIKRQSMEVKPIRDKFVAPTKYETNEKTLKVVQEYGKYRVGPIERMVWWSEYKGESLNQYSS